MLILNKVFAINFHHKFENLVIDNVTGLELG